MNGQLGRQETVPRERSTPGQLPRPHPGQSLSPELGVPRPPGRLLPGPPRSHFLPPPRPFHIPVPPGQPRARRSQPAAHHRLLRARLPARPLGMKAAQAAGEEAPLSGRSVKVVLVGDGGCGKTSLMMVFAAGNFPESYSPTVFERYNVTLQMQGKPVHLQIWDTAGQDDYDRLRPLFYPDANVLLLCFDVTSPNSFDNVSNRGHDMARSVGAVTYLECSARLHDNVEAVFQEAVNVALSSPSRNFWRRITQRFCLIS
ncbi:rho-related GTP-binding protein RhoD isoform X2 [Alexandromys fortis]|uniref:rho-related GTP-binding protein RhoD isoform X2 n=1 Tax=Alexandromys fortis TaxID=100897 RepID=UPI00215299B7|nr:rho-related GTP-binding protein RhoD isoform X2 [Microtus fortis]